jgi:putative ABC transport system permease protein
VVGTLTKEEPSLFGAGGFANMVYIPLKVSMRVFKGAQINRIIIETDPHINPDISLDQVKRTLLANHHNQDDFTVWTQKQLMTAIFKVFNIVTALLAGISLISLIVAGIGIMNIMLVTVTERTKEIGIRKTVGAKNRDIFLKFITEASLLSILGGAIGVGLAEILCRIISMRTVLHPVVTIGIVAMAFGVCFLTGIVFGVGPAIRASRQEPIQALRWE